MPFTPLIMRTATDTHTHTHLLPRLAPEQYGEDEHNDECEVCSKGGNVLCCDNCNLVFHTHCLYPPLTVVPEGDWLCPVCTVEVRALPSTH